MHEPAPYHFSYVYILRSIRSARQIYIGYTRDLRKRLRQHNAGDVISTKKNSPWRVAYYEAFSNDSAAKKREQSLKRNGNPMRELKRRIGWDMKSDKGFALVEILVVVALLAMLFSIALVMSMESFWSSARRSERDIIVSMLQRARSRAMANVSQRPWGVCRDTSDPDEPEYVLFSGSDSNRFSEVRIPGNPGAPVDVTGATVFPCGNGGVVFAQLTGKTSAVSISITEGATTSVISTNIQGRIDW